LTREHGQPHPHITNMFDRLIEFGVSNPGSLRFWGRAAMSASTVLALLGLRFGRRIGLAERRLQVDLTLDQVLPWWLTWAVPESTAGWIVLLLVFAGGVCLAATGKKIELATR
jgi:hypothetical protein